MKKLRAKLNQFVRVLGMGWIILIGISSLVGFVGILAIGLMNAEYLARTQQLITIKPPNTSGREEIPLVLRLRVLNFDESAGRVSAQLFAYTRDHEYRRRLEADSARIYVSITDGMSTNSISNLERARLTFSADTIPNVSYLIAQSNVLELRPLYLTDVSIFPFDTYRARLIIWMITSRGLDRSFVLEVEKSYFTRTMEAEGTPDEVIITARRPFLDRMVVVGSSAMFLLVCGVVIASLVVNRDRLSGFEQALALTGFVLSAVGFREFAGFTSLGSRSFLDVVVFLLPLAALLFVFVSRVAINMRRNGDGEA